jgi:hypothetical protein
MVAAPGPCERALASEIKNRNSLSDNSNARNSGGNSNNNNGD